MVSALSRDIETLPAHFERSYRFGPRAAVACIMALTARCLVDSYDEALSFVHQHWGTGMNWEQPPARSGLTRARETLGVEPMRMMWQQQLQRAESIVRPQTHGLPEGRRALAIDGSWMLLPDSEGVRQRWSQAGRTCNTVPQALMVAAIETTQRLPVAATVVGLDTGERTAALTLLQELRQTDILLFDRGYPGREFLGEITRHGFDIVLRMVVGHGAFPEVNAFWKSNADEVVVPVTVSGGETVQMRLIRRRFKSGRPQKGEGREKMVILTTLLDAETYPSETVLEFYHARWEAETFFHEVKVHMQIEAFHSTSPIGIMQEVYACLAWMAIFAIMESRADMALEEVRGPQKWDDPKRYAINRAQLARLVRRNVHLMYADNPEQKQQAAESLGEGMMRLAQQAVRKRPGRHFERKRKSPWGRFSSDSNKKKK